MVDRINPVRTGSIKFVLSMVAVLVVQGCTTIGLGNGVNRPTAAKTQNDVVAPTNLLAALQGGLISQVQSSKITRADVGTALQSEYRALEYTAPGEAVLWQGKNISGRVVPSQPYRVGSQDCRQYEHMITEQGEQKTVRGTACRNEDGSWSLLS